MKFCGFQGTSLIDFPDRVSTVLFTPGCNLRCPFCHNWRIVLEPKEPFLSEDKVLQILDERKNFIDSVVVTGGEPTIHEDLPQFLRMVKERGFTRKIDTNGLRPDVLVECLGYVDYVAMDIKTSPERYEELGAGPHDVLLKSVDLLKNSLVDYEFRCTLVPNFVNEESLLEIGCIIEGAKKFVFQKFIPDDTLAPCFPWFPQYSEATILEFGDLMAEFVDDVCLRI